MAKEVEIEKIEKRPYKLDARDKRILYELDYGGRLTHSQLGKLVGLRSEVVHYRVSRMEEEGIIKGYHLMASIGKLGFWQMKIAVRFQKYNKKIEEELLDFLGSKEYVKRVVACQGTYDMLISIGAINIQKLNEYKEEIFLKLDPYVLGEGVSVYLKILGYRRVYLLSEKESHEEPIVLLGDIVDKTQLDETDKAIFRELSKNGRASIVEVARKIKSTTRTVAYRVKRMENERIILGCRIGISHEAIGANVYKLFVYTKNLKKEREKEFFEYCRKNPSITHLTKVLGSWDYEIEFEYIDETDFYNLIEDLRDTFSDIVKEMNIMKITKEHIRSYY